MGTASRTNKWAQKPWWFLAAVFIVTASSGFTFAWYQTRAPSTAYTGPVETVHTGLIGEYAALIVIAAQQGYFTQHGLDVAITEYPSGPAAISDLLAGKTDMAMGSDFAFVSNSFHQEDIRILATLSKSEAFLIVGRKDHGIGAIQDLQGKRIGITKKTVGEFYLGQFLTINNLKLSDVSIVDMTQAQLADSLIHDQLDAAVLFEPNAYNVKRLLPLQSISWSVQSGQTIYSSLYSTRQFINAHPGAIARYIAALIDAENFVASHNAEARTIIAKRFHYTNNYIAYIWPRFSFKVSLDQELLLNVNDEARWAIENHITDATEAPNYLDFIYFQALDAVKPEAVTIIH